MIIVFLLFLRLLFPKRIPPAFNGLFVFIWVSPGNAFQHAENHGEIALKKMP